MDYTKDDQIMALLAEIGKEVEGYEFSKSRFGVDTDVMRGRKKSLLSNLETLKKLLADSV